MRTLKMPPFLHDVFGTEQDPTHLFTIIAFGVGLPAVLYLHDPAVFAALPMWKAILAILLIGDIAAGCIANFTRPTNDFYAARAMNRWVFIAIHIHVIAVAFALEMALGSSFYVWGFTIGAAIVVNLLKGYASQKFWAGALTTAGLGGLILFSQAAAILLVVQALFMFKVIFSFAVDHYDT